MPAHEIDDLASLLAPGLLGRRRVAGLHVRVVHIERHSPDLHPHQKNSFRRNAILQFAGIAIMLVDHFPIGRRVSTDKPEFTPLPGAGRPK